MAPKHRAQLLLMSEHLTRDKLAELLHQAVEMLNGKYGFAFQEDLVKAYVIDDMEDED